MLIRSIIVSLLLILTVSCDGQEPRRPIKKHSGSFIKESAIKNKEIYDEERKFLENLIAKDSTHHYISSNHGFWYYYKVKDTAHSKSPQVGDYVRFSYDIRNIKDELIVAKEENGIQHYKIDQTNQELFSGIREGLKLMKEGEEVTFLFPSYKAFGYYGLADKIGSNIPVISTVRLIAIEEANATNNSVSPAN